MTKGRRTVLVTGGTGFVGSRVVRRFLDADWRVISFALPGEAPDPSWRGDVEMAGGDLTQPGSLASAVGDFDLVIHLAAVVGQAGNYDRQWSVIADGTGEVCTLAADRGARAVVISSIAVYGDKIRRQLCREADGFGVWQGAYGRAKQGQEAVALETAARFGVPTTIVRPANVYGLGRGSAWGDRFIDAIKASGGLVVGAADQNNAGLVHVENLADALFLAGTHPDAPGGVFNVGDGEPVTWRQFTDDMAALAGKRPPPVYPLADLLRLAEDNEDPASLVGPRQEGLPYLEGLNLIGFDNRISADHIRERLGWRPALSYPDAIAAMADQLKASS